MMTEDELRDIPILVLATKQDLPRTMTADEISQSLSLEKSLQGTQKESFGTDGALKMDNLCISGRDWAILPVASLMGQGTSEALDWIVAAIRRNRDKVYFAIVVA